MSSDESRWRKTLARPQLQAEVVLREEEEVPLDPWPWRGPACTSTAGKFPQNLSSQNQPACWSVTKELAQERSLQRMMPQLGGIILTVRPCSSGPRSPADGRTGATSSSQDEPVRLQGCKGRAGSCVRGKGGTLACFLGPWEGGGRWKGVR